MNSTPHLVEALFYSNSEDNKDNNTIIIIAVVTRVKTQDNTDEPSLNMQRISQNS